MSLIRKEDDICLADEQPEDNYNSHQQIARRAQQQHMDNHAAKKPFMKKLSDLSKSCYPKRPKVSQK